MTRHQNQLTTSSGFLITPLCSMPCLSVANHSLSQEGCAQRTWSLVANVNYRSKQKEEDLTSHQNQDVKGGEYQPTPNQESPVDQQDSENSTPTTQLSSLSKHNIVADQSPSQNGYAQQTWSLAANVNYRSKAKEEDLTSHQNQHVRGEDYQSTLNLESPVNHQDSENSIPSTQVSFLSKYNLGSEETSSKTLPTTFIQIQMSKDQTTDDQVLEKPEDHPATAEGVCCPTCPQPMCICCHGGGRPDSKRKCKS